MQLNIEEKDLNKLIIVGDRVLIQPKSPEQKTKSGLFLPPGVHESEKVYLGFVIKTGPGYPIPSADESEPWMDKSRATKYFPLQAQIGDLAVYLQNSAYEIEFNKQKYVLVPHSAILMLMRDEGLFE